MKPYPAYKDSGIEWLGMVPEGWATTQLKRFATMTYGDALASETRDDDAGIPVYGSNGPVGWHSIGNTLAPVILIGRKGSFGALNWSDCACFAIDTVYFVDCRSASCNLRWLYWAMHNANFDALSQDTGVPGLSRASAHGTWFALPPLPEQQAIAAFLDRETAKIDGLIEEQRRLISLLAEKRQATISHAVTRGLNPSARLKPSGVDWLGDIPEGWEVVPLKRKSPEITVGIVVEPSKYYVESGVPALRSLNVRTGRISGDNMVYISDNANELMSKSMLRHGDVVAVRTGQPGTCAVVPQEFDGANCIDLIIVRRSAQLDSEYLVWFLTSDPALRQFSEGSGGAIQLHFNVSAAKEILVSFPPLAEQREIAAYLSRITAQLDTLTETAITAITLLQERRAALISAAVTGKIDVRDTNTREAA